MKSLVAVWMEFALVDFLFFFSAVLPKYSVGSHAYVGFGSPWPNKGLEATKLSPFPKQQIQFRK